MSWPHFWPLLLSSSLTPTPAWAWGECLGKGDKMTQTHFHSCMRNFHSYGLTFTDGVLSVPLGQVQCPCRVR